MDGVHNVRVALNTVIGIIALSGIQCVGVIDQTLHLLLGAAIAQFQVVQHGIVLLGKPLIGVLDGLHVRAHLVGVVAHVGDGPVGFFRCGRCVIAHGLEQGRGETGHRLHVLVGGQACRFIGSFSVLNHCVGRAAEQRFHAAHQLLVLPVVFNSGFCEGDYGSGRRCGGRRCGLGSHRKPGLQGASELRNNACVLHFVVHSLNPGLRAVNVCGRVVQSLLPPLDLIAVFRVVGLGVVQSLLNLAQALLLDFQLSVQHVGLSRQLFLAVVVNVKGGGHRRHFRTKCFKLLPHGF